MQDRYADILRKTLPNCVSSPIIPAEGRHSIHSQGCPMLSRAQEQLLLRRSWGEEDLCLWPGPHRSEARLPRRKGGIRDSVRAEGHLTLGAQVLQSAKDKGVRRGAKAAHAVPKLCRQGLVSRTSSGPRER